MSDAHRIAVTGLGVVSPLGSDLGTFHRALSEGRSGIVEVEPSFPTGYRTNRAGIVQDLAVPEGIGRTPYLAEVACRAALAQGGMDGLETCGVVLGTAMGEGLEMEVVLGERALADGDPGSYGAPRLDGIVAHRLGLGGPCHLVSTTCASGNHAIDWAAQLLRAGFADAMLAVGVDTLGHVDMLGFCRLLLQAPDRCRPFDLRRKGTILSEGSGAILLERLDVAKRRGAVILAELAGCGLSCDAAGAFNSQAYEVTTLERAAHDALREAGIPADAVDFVSAHGSGTKLNDARETKFAKALFGDRAFHVPMSSIKSMLGHAQGAAASFEFIASVLSIQNDVLYPTMHLENPDPDCDLDYLPNQAREQRIDVVLSNAFGVGGNNSLVLIKRWSG